MEALILFSLESFSTIGFIIKKVIHYEVCDNNDSIFGLL